MTDEFSNRIDVHFDDLSPEYREKMIDAVLAAIRMGFRLTVVERPGNPLR